MLSYPIPHDESLYMQVVETYPTPTENAPRTGSAESGRIEEIVSAEAIYNHPQCNIRRDRAEAGGGAM